MTNTTKPRWTRPRIDFVDPRTQPYVEMKSRGELPHLYKEGGSYFVTFRLWDAVESNCGAGVSPAYKTNPGVSPAYERNAGGTPAPQNRCKQSWIEIQKEFINEKSWTDLSLAQRLAEITEPPLTLGSCLLNRNDVATAVENSLLHFHEQRYLLTAWCVMPNHVHVAYTALYQHTPEDIHHSWKSFLSHQINRIANRTGTLWERESFDHLIRSVEHYEYYIDYIERNPVAAALCKQPADWKFSSAKYH